MRAVSSNCNGFHASAAGPFSRFGKTNAARGRIEESKGSQARKPALEAGFTTSGGLLA